MKKSTTLFLSLLALTLVSSCLSRKDLQYFDYTQAISDSIPAYFPGTPGLYKLAPNDILSVRIKTEDPKFAQGFNLQGEMGFNMGSPGANYLNSYTISDSGMVNLPIIGEMFLQGLNLEEARAAIQEKVNKFLIGATVVVHLVNHRISILGEVRNPGFYYLYFNQLNIFEAMAMAGDVTNIADRSNVVLIRKREGGSETIALNLADMNVMSSPYYYLAPDDVVIVMPVKQKAPRANFDVAGVMNTAFSGISTIVTVALFILNLNRNP